MSAVALDRLFQSHLRVLDRPGLTLYLSHHHLPAWPLWKDASGKEWNLLERAVHLAVADPRPPTHPALLFFLWREYIRRRAEGASPEGVPLTLLERTGDPLAHMLQDVGTWGWGKSGPWEKQLWEGTFLAQARLNSLSTSREAGTKELEPLEFLLGVGLRRSFARCAIGTPASGFGEPGDGGWLHSVLATLERLLQEQDPAAARLPTWANVASDWWKDNLLIGIGGHRFWGWGGVRGSKKNMGWSDAPGWETRGSLPGENARAPRPSALGPHWSALSARLMNLLALALERDGGKHALASLGLDDLLERDTDPSPVQTRAWNADRQGLYGAPLTEKEVTEYNQRLARALLPWMTPALEEALVRVACAGLLVDDPLQEIPAHHRCDGRSLDAVEWLVAVGATGPLWQHHREALAQAVLRHQHAWETSEKPWERALGQSEIAPATRPVGAWAATWAPAIGPASWLRRSPR